MAPHQGLSTTRPFNFILVAASDETLVVRIVETTGVARQVERSDGVRVVIAADSKKVNDLKVTASAD